MWTPRATSRVSRRARYGASEYAWMVWSAPKSPTLRRMLPYMVPGIFVIFDVRCLTSLRRSNYRLCNLVCVLVVFWLVVQSCGQVLNPPKGGAAPVNVISGSMGHSTTLRTASSASSMCVTPVCDYTLPICVLYSRVSLVWMMSSAGFRRSLCGWWMKLSCSMAYFQSVLMLTALYVSI